MTTAYDLVKSMMRKAGILTKTESPSADEAADGLQTLNDMLASWATDGINTPFRTLESFPVTSGTANYTIGSGGTFNTTRPNKVVSAYVRLGTTDYEVFPISDEAYASLEQKDSTGTPDRLNYTNAHPLSIIRLYPVPDSSYTLYLLTEKKIGGYTLHQTVDLPDGWNRAIIYQGAVEISPEYGVTVPQEVAMIAAEAMGNLRRAVIRNRPIDVNSSGNSFDIFTGWTG